MHETSLTRRDFLRKSAAVGAAAIGSKAKGLYAGLANFFNNIDEQQSLLEKMANGFREHISTIAQQDLSYITGQRLAGYEDLSTVGIFFPTYIPLMGNDNEKAEQMADLSILLYGFNENFGGSQTNPEVTEFNKYVLSEGARRKKRDISLIEFKGSPYQANHHAPVTLRENSIDVIKPKNRELSLESLGRVWQYKKIDLAYQNLEQGLRLQ